MSFRRETYALLNSYAAVQTQKAVSAYLNFTHYR